MDTMTNTPMGQPLFTGDLQATPPIKPFWLVGFGILLVSLGALAFVSVVTATVVSVYFVAISMIMAGAAEISLGVQSKSLRRTITWV